MGTKKRSQEQILFEILKICNGRGVIITKIAGLSNLNFRSLPKYINLLVENDLIEVVSEDAILYKTTQKGIKALWHFEQLKELIPGMCPNDGFEVPDGPPSPGLAASQKPEP
jgi:predicted transcriptional regulator